MNQRVKILSALTGVLLAGLLTASALAATGPERLEWEVDRGAGPVGFSVERSTTLPDSERPKATTRFEFSIAKGFRLNPKVVSSCSQARIERDAAGCRSARIATGSALIDFRPAVAEPIEARVETFKTGRPRGTIVGLVTKITLPTGSVYQPALIRRARGEERERFSYVFVEDVPGATQEGPIARTFELDFPKRVARVGGKRRGLIEATRSCPSKNLVFGLDSTYVDGTASSTTDRVRCVR